MKPDEPFAVEVLRAAREITQQAAYYRMKETESLALRWRRAVNSAVASLAFSPLRGSNFPLSTESRIRLRRIPIDGFPKHGGYYRVFEQARIVVLVAVLHSARDPNRVLPGSRFAT